MEESSASENVEWDVKSSPPTTKKKSWEKRSAGTRNRPWRVATQSHSLIRVISADVLVRLLAGRRRVRIIWSAFFETRTLLRNGGLVMWGRFVNAHAFKCMQPAEQSQSFCFQRVLTYCICEEECLPASCHALSPEFVRFTWAWGAHTQHFCRWSTVVIATCPRDYLIRFTLFVHL
jgi:hypothetical protein